MFRVFTFLGMCSSVNAFTRMGGDISANLLVHTDKQANRQLLEVKAIMYVFYESASVPVLYVQVHVRTHPIDNLAIKARA